MEVSHKRTLREIADETEADWMKTTGQPRGFTLCIAVLGFQHGAHDGLWAARWLFCSFLSPTDDPRAALPVPLARRPAERVLLLRL